MKPNKTIRALKIALEKMNEQTPPHLRYEEEFRMIRDILDKADAMEAPLDEDLTVYCPRCNEEVYYYNGDLSVNKYCEYCGQHYYRIFEE